MLYSLCSFANMNGYIRIAANICYYLITGVLLFSGISKILDPMPLNETIKFTANLPEELLIIIATLLPLIEISLGLLMVLRIKPKPVLLVTLILFAAFFLFSVYGTITGLKNDCGCFGSLVKSEIGWWMVIRNLLFLIAGVFIIYNIEKEKTWA
ncbi:MAG: methylamine utilization protein [Flavobacterium sp.]|nr:methylamine utilization protein [Flavobacterium sp.]